MFIFLNQYDMTSNGMVYSYPWLDTTKFIEIHYNEDASEAVVKTKQQNIPPHIQQITEQQFDQFVAQWPAPPVAEPVYETPSPSTTIGELNEKVDLLIMMQLEKEGVL